MVIIYSHHMMCCARIVETEAAVTWMMQRQTPDLFALLSRCRRRQGPVERHAGTTDAQFLHTIHTAIETDTVPTTVNHCQLAVDCQELHSSEQPNGSSKTHSLQRVY
jgi:hypothetical protein